MAGISIDYGSVQIFDDAVPPDLYRQLEVAVAHAGWYFGWRASVGRARYWHHEISGGEKTNTQDVTAAVRKHRIAAYAQYVDWLRNTLVPEDTRLLRMYMNAHTFGTDGSPHTDSDRDNELTTILYMNPEWKPQFGGETVVFDAAGDIETSVMPRPNRLITFPSNRLHAPRPLSKLYPGLRVVLVCKLGAAERDGAGFDRRD
jgi:SM-20-related protein